MLKLKCCKLPDYFYFTVLLKLSCRVFTSLESHHQNGCDKIGNIFGLKTLGFQDHSRKLYFVSFMVLEQDSTIRSFMLKWLFILIISLILSTELFADYFKWEILVSENGYGKRTALEAYRVTNRGGKGVTTLKITEKTGELVSIKRVNDDDDLMIIKKSGVTIRFHLSDLRTMGRATQGVRLLRVTDKDGIASVAKVPREEEKEEEVESQEGIEGAEGTVENVETPENTESSETPTDDENSQEKE
jgi:DNA gyrase/topoisomerase IV subunit A